MRSRRVLEQLEPYRYGLSDERIARENGIGVEDVIRFDTNTVPYVLQSVKDGWEGIAKLRVDEYPDPTYQTLLERIANYAGVDKNQVILKAGGDEIIDLIARTFIEIGDKAVIPEPTFSMFGISVNRRGGRVISIQRENDFSVDVRRLIKKAKDSKLVFICNPNNPSGNMMDLDDIEEIVGNVDGIVVVDEAYVEFSGGSAVSLIGRYDNLIVIRTLSKAFGLAGARIGYGISSPILIREMEKLKMPYSLSTASFALGKAALSGKGIKEMRKKVKLIMREKKRMEKKLLSLGFFVYPSACNFMLIKPNLKPDILFKGLLKKGLVIRVFEKDESVDGCIRINARTRKENERLMKELRRVVLSNVDGIIFDVDGVLVDVSESYRKTIKEVAKRYKKKINDRDIERLRSIGFNNDWDITYALLKGATVVSGKDRKSRKYAEIKSLFQKIYLGRKGKPGFVKKEKLLIKKNTLKWLLANEIKLGVATSRPREEALMALGSLMPRFISKKAIVAQEDAPEKPNPDSLILSKKRMSSDYPLYVGDSYADELASQRAGFPFLSIGRKGSWRMRDVNEIVRIMKEVKI